MLNSCGSKKEKDSDTRVERDSADGKREEKHRQGCGEVDKGEKKEHIASREREYSVSDEAPATDLRAAASAGTTSFHLVYFSFLALSFSLCISPVLPHQPLSQPSILRLSSSACPSYVPSSSGHGPRPSFPFSTWSLIQPTVSFYLIHARSEAR